MPWKLTALAFCTVVSAITFASLRSVPGQLGTFTRIVTVPSGHAAKNCDGGLQVAELVVELPAEGDLAGWERLAMDVSSALDCTVWTTPGDNLMKTMGLARGLVQHADDLRAAKKPAAGVEVLLDLWALGQNLQDGTLVQQAIGLAIQRYAVDPLFAMGRDLPVQRQRELVEPILDQIDRSPPLSFVGEQEYLSTMGAGVWSLAVPFCRAGSQSAAERLEPALISVGPERFAKVRLAPHEEPWTRLNIASMCRTGAMRVMAHHIWDRAELLQEAATMATNFALQDACPQDLSLLMSRVPVDPATGAALTYADCAVKPADFPDRPDWR
jgi:hypothetical protein